MKTLRLLAALALCPLSGAAAGFDALKSADFAAVWQSAALLPRFSPAPPMVRPTAVVAVAAQTLIYERTGWDMEYEAQNAATRAERAFRDAGMAALSSTVYRDASNNYGFRLEYLPAANEPNRQIQTHKSGLYGYASDAEQAMNRAGANLRASGYDLILGRVLREVGGRGDYFFEVDYVAGRRDRPGDREQTFTSPYYQYQNQAYNEMNAAIYQLQARGYDVFSATLYRDNRNGLFFYQLRYRGRR